VNPPNLQKYDGSPGMCIAESFWSFHSLLGRRGCCTASSRKHNCIYARPPRSNCLNMADGVSSVAAMCRCRCCTSSGLYRPDRLAISQFFLRVWCMRLRFMLWGMEVLLDRRIAKKSNSFPPSFYGVSVTGQDPHVSSTHPQSATWNNPH
jgi:hypothetical protein